MIEQFNFEAYHKKVEQIMARTGGLAMRPVKDPNPHEREEVFKGFAGRNTLVQIRTNPDHPDPDQSFAWVDQLRGPGFPMIFQIPFNEDPKIANRNYCTLRKKLDALLKRDW